MSVFKTDRWTGAGWRAVAFAMLLPGVAMAQSPEYSVVEARRPGSTSGAIELELRVRLSPRLPASIPVSTSVERPLQTYRITEYHGHFCMDSKGGDPLYEAYGPDLKRRLLSIVVGKTAKELLSLSYQVDEAQSARRRLELLFGIPQTDTRFLETPQVMPEPTAREPGTRLDKTIVDGLILGRPQVLQLTDPSRSECLTRAQVDEAIATGRRVLNEIIAVLDPSAQENSAAGKPK